MADDSNVKSGLALFPLRREKRLRSSTNEENCVIKLWSADEKMIVLGRLQLIPCLYAACGCDSDFQSTKNKCQECQGVNKWISSLSKQMLRFCSSGTGSTLQVRGVHAAAFVNDKPIGGHDPGGEWRGNEPIQAGDILSLSPFVGSGRLDFEVALVNCKTLEHITSTSIESSSSKAVNCNLQEQEESDYSETDSPRMGTQSISPRDCKMREKQSEISASSPQRPAPNKKQKDKSPSETNTNIIPATIGPVDSGTRSNNPTETNQMTPSMRLYFVALGQDLPRHRIETLSGMAKRLGASVASNFRLATHLIISELVSSLTPVAELLEIEEGVLRTHIEQVSACRVSVEERRSTRLSLSTFSFILLLEQDSLCQPKVDLESHGKLFGGPISFGYMVWLMFQRC
jgi:hypothetical protein